MRDTQRGRDIDRERSRLHAGSPTWDSILRLWDHAHEPKADAQPLSHPGAGNYFLLTIFTLLRIYA